MICLKVTSAGHFVTFIFKMIYIRVKIIMVILLLEIYKRNSLMVHNTICYYLKS